MIYNLAVDNNFGGVIWTNHSLDRLKKRGISQGDAWATLSHPQSSKFAQTKNAWVFYRNYSGYQIEVVATQNEEKKWVVLSVWSKPSQTWSKQIFPSRVKQSANPKFLENLVEKIMQKLFGRLRKKNEKQN